MNRLRILSLNAEWSLSIGCRVLRKERKPSVLLELYLIDLTRKEENVYLDQIEWFQVDVTLWLGFSPLVVLWRSLSVVDDHGL